MIFVSVYRIIKFAFQNFWRNFWLSIITISMLVLTLLSVNILVTLNVVTEEAINVVEDRIEISVYFYPETSQERVSSAAGYLRGLQQVRDVEIVTRDEALTRFRNRHQNDQAILQSLEEIEGNPFGPSLVVKAYSADDFPFIIDTLENPQFRDDIREKDFANYESLIERIRDITDRVRMFGYGLSAVFLAIAVLIVFNTVRIGIFIHREEIGIMKLVGATNWFIRAPFLFEAILFSLFATAIVAAIMFPSVAAMEPRFNEFLGGQSVGLVDYYQNNAWQLFGIQFAILALINMISTSFAMRKYLDV
jgi:cell division transport system permease protein